MFSYPAAKIQFMRQKERNASDLRSIHNFPRAGPKDDQDFILFMKYQCTKDLFLKKMM